MATTTYNAYFADGTPIRDQWTRIGQYNTIDEAAGAIGAHIVDQYVTEFEAAKAERDTDTEDRTDSEIIHDITDLLAAILAETGDNINLDDPADADTINAQLTAAYTWTEQVEHEMVDPDDLTTVGIIPCTYGHVGIIEETQ